MEAAQAFAGGLYAGLVRSDSLTGAVNSGRRAVRGLSLPWPDARWSRIQLTVTSLQLPESLLWRSWLPEGWPRPSQAAAAVLHQAHALAEHHGFVGVEHLLLAIADAPVQGYLSRVKSRCSARQKRLEDLLVRWVPTPTRPTWRGTPRLRALGDRLPDGFTLEQLWEHLLDHHPTLLEWLLDLDLSIHQHSGSGFETETSNDAFFLQRDVPPGGLEVLGGPECGRRLTPAPGATIGRHDAHTSRPDVLYAHTPCTDTKLSREHLVWHGRGRITAVQKGRRHTSISHIPPREARRPLTDDTVMVGDLLRIGGSTVLLVIGEEA